MFKICLAPMLDVTTGHFCQFIKHINSKIQLFSEMFVDNTILFMADENLDFYMLPYPKKTTIQIGGSDPLKIAQCVLKLKTRYGFTKFNLNCGCPSDRVKSGRFGAILMKDVDLVCDIINKVYEITQTIISIKCRNGICLKRVDFIEDEVNDYKFFREFIEAIIEKTLCRTFYVHCRSCILDGLSPKANRTIPKLNYEFAFRIKEMYPFLQIIINGGIKIIDIGLSKRCDGIMIGREAIANPFVFLDGNSERVDVLFKYIKSFSPIEIARPAHILPMNNVFKGNAGTKMFKQMLNRIIQERITFSEVVIRFEVFFDELNQKAVRMKFSKDNIMTEMIREE